MLFSYSSSCQEILSSLNIVKTNETELQTNYSQDNQRPQWSTPEKTFTVMFSPTLKPRYLGHTYGTLQLSLCVSYKNLSQFLNIIFFFENFYSYTVSISPPFIYKSHGNIIVKNKIKRPICLIFKRFLSEIKEYCKEMFF